MRDACCVHVFLDHCDTVDWEIFVLKIIRVLNFHIYF